MSDQTETKRRGRKPSTDLHPRFEVYAKWLKDNKGIEVEPMTAQVIQRSYPAFSKSPENAQFQTEHKTGNVEEQLTKLDARRQARLERIAKQEELAKKDEERRAKLLAAMENAKGNGVVKADEDEAEDEDDEEAEAELEEDEAEDDDENAPF